MLVCRMQRCEGEEEGRTADQLRVGRRFGLLEGGGEVQEWDEEGLMLEMFY